MPDFNDVLHSLENTQEFFRFETREYKDFRNALSALNRAMIACGNRNLTANEVLNLRTLTAKARETWGSYMGQIQERIRRGVQNQIGQGNQIGQNLENPNVPDVVNPLSGTDKRRMQILNGMTEILDSDLDALRNYDITRNLNLEQIILENRGLTADIRGQNPAIIGNYSSSRMVLEVNGVRGAFTEDYAGVDPVTVREQYAALYPQIAEVLRRMDEDQGYLNVWSIENIGSPEELTQKLLTRSDPTITAYGNALQQMITTRWNIPFPAGLAQEDGKLWFENREFVRQFSESIYQICKAKDTMTAADVGLIEAGKNIPRRNAAMSVIADRIGRPDLLARSKVMKIRTGQGEKTGVFMEWAKGKDLKKDTKTGKILPDLNGKKLRFNSARLIKSAADLQALDFICGNTDRHSGNMLYQFEEIDGVMTLVGVQGIDNDSSFGRADGTDERGKLASLDDMLVMTRSTAEAVMNLSKDELKYSLYGLVSEEEIDLAWQRTRSLQDKIKESAKVKWKSDTSLRRGSIRIFDDNDPVWDKFNTQELRMIRTDGRQRGVFASISSEIEDYKETEKGNKVQYQDHSREGIRKSHYTETERTTLYSELRELRFPALGQDTSVRDVFLLYRNRNRLHQEQDAVTKGAALFDRAMAGVLVPRGNINIEMGRTEKVDTIYIDGLPAAEYVRKYSPENAGNKNYVKAQVMAALTSGRHHVDAVMLRTQEDGTFRACASELTMNLSALNGEE